MEASAKAEHRTYSSRRPSSTPAAHFHPRTATRPMTDGPSTPSAGASRRWTPVTLGGDVPPPRGAYTPAIRAGDFVFVSGQVPQDPRTGQIVGGDVQAQTRQVMDNVRLALESA